MSSAKNEREADAGAFGFIVEPPVLSILAKEHEAGTHYREAFVEEIQS